MDKDWVEKSVFILDDPLNEYEDDFVLIKKLFNSFLPKIKQTLHIDDIHTIRPYFEKNISFLRKNKHIVDDLIQQQLSIYKNIKNTS